MIIYINSDVDDPRYAEPSNAEPEYSDVELDNMHYALGLLQEAFPGLLAGFQLTDWDYDLQEVPKLYKEGVSIYATGSQFRVFHDLHSNKHLFDSCRAILAAHSFPF